MQKLKKKRKKKVQALKLNCKILLIYLKEKKRIQHMQKNIYWKILIVMFEKESTCAEIKKYFK